MHILKFTEKCIENVGGGGEPCLFETWGGDIKAVQTFIAGMVG